MAKSGPKHVVVDGSNLATEGRTKPSLSQLNDAVLAFMKEYPDTRVTVVVDATFGHRIDKKELAEFNSAIDNNELVSPPAGAVGRGDGFVLTIAEKVGASIVSNDSYQEFQGQYPWLFEPGRLIGGKPVPNVGWVFIERLPVRPLATKAVKKASREASKPMPVPKAPPPGARLAAKPKPVAVKTPASRPSATRPQPKALAKVVKQKPAPKAPTKTVNELQPFLDFVEKHGVGSKVKGVVDSYSAHGVYVKIGDVLGYLPLRLMANPAPRSAREQVKIGQAVSLVVDSFVPSRRSIDVAIAGVVVPESKPTKVTKKKRVAAKKAMAKKK
jgi:hypothetical protein